VPAGGYKLPKGQDVMISIYNLHHSPAGGVSSIMRTGSRLPWLPEAAKRHELHISPAWARNRPRHAAPHRASAHSAVSVHSAVVERCISCSASCAAVWDDPEDFKPERFPLDGPVPTEQNTDYRYIPFSAGPRCAFDTCPPLSTLDP
jgi:Cytochrome P450